MHEGAVLFVPTKAKNNDFLKKKSTKSSNIYFSVSNKHVFTILASFNRVY